MLKSYFASHHKCRVLCSSAHRTIVYVIAQKTFSLARPFLLKRRSTSCTLLSTFSAYLVYILNANAWNRFSSIQKTSSGSLFQSSRSRCSAPPSSASVEILENIISHTSVCVGFILSPCVAVATYIRPSDHVSFNPNTQTTGIRNIKWNRRRWRRETPEPVDAQKAHNNFLFTHFHRLILVDCIFHICSFAVWPFSIWIWLPWTTCGKCGLSKAHQPSSSSATAAAAAAVTRQYLYMCTASVRVCAFLCRTLGTASLPICITHETQNIWWRKMYRTHIHNPWTRRRTKKWGWTRALGMVEVKGYERLEKSERERRERKKRQN